MSREVVPRLRLDQRPRANVAVATLCRDRPEVVRHFVEAHRRMGVARIMLYFDDPADPVHDWAAAQSGVEALRCDDAFWAKWSKKGDGKRPPHVEARQRSVFAHAHRDIASNSWVGFCDVDEVFVPLRDFNATFGKVSPLVEEVLAPVAEAFWPPGAAADADFSAPLLRSPQFNAEESKVLGRAASALFLALASSGTAGHRWGKAFVRGGVAGLRPGIHHHRVQTDNLPKRLARVKGDMLLVHYDAVSFQAWRDKHQARIRRDALMGGNSAGRKAQTELLALAGGDEAVERRLFQSLYGSTDAYIEALMTVGALMRIESPAAPDGSAAGVDELLARLARRVAGRRGSVSP